LSSYEGLVYGPESRPDLAEPFDVLYALDPTNGLIDRFEIGPSGILKTNIYDRENFLGTDLEIRPGFAAFNEFGDLLVTSRDSARVLSFMNLIPIGDGIQFVIPPAVMPVPWHVWTGAAGSMAGIDVGAEGELLAVNQGTGQVLSFAFDPEFRSYGAPAELVGGLTSPVGDGITANRDVLVADGVAVKRFDKDGNPYTDESSNVIHCAANLGGTVVAVTPSANDTLHVTVHNAANDAATLYEIPFGYNPCPGEFEFFCGGATPLATFSGPTPLGTAPPLVAGVALPFTGRLAYTDTPECPASGYAGPPVQGSKPVDGGEGWNFFDLYATFNPVPGAGADQCAVTISSQEFSPIRIGEVIDNPLNKLSPSRPLVLPGDQGAMRVLTYTPSVDESLCPPGTPDGEPKYVRGVSAFFSRVNPKLALCHALGLQDCDLQRLKTLDLEFGFIPGDGNLSGFNPRFSEGFLVDQVPADGEYDGVWCDVDPPVNNEEPWLEVNSGSVVPIDIKPVLAGNECGAKTIPDLVAVLSVWYVDEQTNTATEVPFEDLNFTGSGSADPLRAVFFEGANPKKPYSLNWDTNDRNGDRLPAGLYKLNIIDDTAATRGIDAIYFPPQVVYVILS
jgi:hypothetical protein